jgi:hypothetical protein
MTAPTTRLEHAARVAREPAAAYAALADLYCLVGRIRPGPRVVLNPV